MVDLDQATDGVLCAIWQVRPTLESTILLNPVKTHGEQRRVQIVRIPKRF